MQFARSECEDPIVGEIEKRQEAFTPRSGRFIYAISQYLRNIDSRHAKKKLEEKKKSQRNSPCNKCGRKGHHADDCVECTEPCPLCGDEVHTVQMCPDNRRGFNFQGAHWKNFRNQDYQAGTHSADHYDAREDESSDNETIPERRRSRTQERSQSPILRRRSPSPIPRRERHVNQL